MKEHKRSNKNLLGFLSCGVGGVLLSCVLALIPNHAFATVNFPENITSDYRVHLFNSQVKFYGGCNTVKSGSGILAVGARGSITGADDNSDGCGYYWNTNDNSLSFRNNGGYSLYYRFNNSGVKDHDWGSLGLGSMNDQFLSYKFRSSVQEIGSTDLAIGSSSSDYYNIQSQSSDSQYGQYIYMIAWRVSANNNIIQSHLTPSIVKHDGDYVLPNGVSEDQFKKDVFEHTIYDFGSPTDYIPADLANYFALNMNLTSCGGWDACDVAYIISYLPQYANSYTINSLHYDVINNITQGTIDTSLGGFSQWEIGAGNNSSSSTYPKLSYFYLGQPYLKDVDTTSDIIYKVNNAMFVCISATCRDQAEILVNNVINKHNTDTSGWDFSENVGGSWFGVFNFDLIFPFSSLFTSFTNDRCVNIPTLASWLHTNQNQYCSWWSQDIRNTLTPVFNTLAFMILFGFIIHWLNGSSSPMFRDNDTTRLGDRF